MTDQPKTRLVFIELPTFSGTEASATLNAQGLADYVLQLWPSPQAGFTQVMLRVPIDFVL